MLASIWSRDVSLFYPIMSFKYQTPKNNVSGNVSNGLNKEHSSGSVQPYHLGAGLHIHIVWKKNQASKVTKDRDVGVRRPTLPQLQSQALARQPLWPKGHNLVPKSSPKLVFNLLVFLL